jgi:hypothetical protein
MISVSSVQDKITLEAFVQAASSLEELIIVWSAIEHPLNRTVVA